MAGQSVTYVKISDLNKAYRRSSTKLYTTYARRVPEYMWVDDIPEEDIIPSGRENLIPLDTARGYGAHQMDDAGDESRTETPALTEGSFVYNHTNARFSISLRQQAFDRVARGNYIIRQIKYQSMKCIEGVMRKWAYMFYGFSTGVVCQSSGTAGGAGTSHTLTLMNGFGLTAVNDAAYLAAMFTTGEGVSLVRGGVLVTNAIGTVTSVNTSTPSINVTWIGSVTPADGDNIVYANGVNNITLSATDYSKWNVGWFDALITDTVHGVSTASVPTWAPALYDTNGGSFGFVKMKRLKQALENAGDTTLRQIIYSQGVENDFQARERQAVIWTNPNQMNVDANVTAKGVSFDSSRFTPPTFAFARGADALGKSVVTDNPEQDEVIEYGRLYKAEDKSALKGGVDAINAMIWRSRSRTAAYGNLNES